MTDTKIAISVLIPCFNEDWVIFDTLEKIEASLIHSGRSFEIIVIDDGSIDGTLERVYAYMEVSDRVHLIKNSENMGKGGAIQAGVAQAMGEIIAFIDADLETEIHCLHKYIETLHTDQSIDIVVGSKFVKGAKARSSRFRHTLSLILSKINRLFFSLPVHDTQVGLKIFRKAIAKKLFKSIDIKGYAFDVELLMRAHAAGARIHEQPVSLTLSKRKSRLEPRAIFTMLIDIMDLYRRTLPERITGISDKSARIVFYCKHVFLYPLSYIISSCAILGRRLLA